MISVIVPVYKVEPFLDDCVKSILAQSFTDFELILVDDGSPDGCPAMCDLWAEKDSRIRVIHKENGGLSSARNAGLDVMRGEYLTFIDSDDTVSDDYLEKLYNALTEYNADVSVCEFLRDGNSLADRTDKSPTVCTGKEACLMVYSDSTPRLFMVSACTKLYKSFLFKELRFPLGKQHEDQFVTYRALYHAATVAVLHLPLYCYRDNPASITRSGFNLKRYDNIAALDEAISFYKSKGDKELYKTAKAQRDAYLSYYRFAARRSGIAKQVPKEYRISFFKAWRTLEKYFSNDLFELRMSAFHPRLVRLRAYIRRPFRPFIRSAE